MGNKLDHPTVAISEPGEGLSCRASGVGTSILECHETPEAKMERLKEEARKAAGYVPPKTFVRQDQGFAPNFSRGSNKLDSRTSNQAKSMANALTSTSEEMAETKTAESDSSPIEVNKAYEASINRARRAAGYVQPRNPTRDATTTQPKIPVSKAGVKRARTDPIPQGKPSTQIRRTSSPTVPHPPIEVLAATAKRARAACASPIRPSTQSRSVSSIRGDTNSGPTPMGPTARSLGNTSRTNIASNINRENGGKSDAACTLKKPTQSMDAYPLMAKHGISLGMDDLSKLNRNRLLLELMKFNEVENIAVPEVQSENLPSRHTHFPLFSGPYLAYTEVLLKQDIGKLTQEDASRWLQSIGIEVPNTLNESKARLNQIFDGKPPNFELRMASQPAPRRLSPQHPPPPLPIQYQHPPRYAQLPPCNVLRKKDVVSLGKTDAAFWLKRVGMAIPDTVPEMRARLHRFFDDKPDNYAVTIYHHLPPYTPKVPSGGQSFHSSIRRLSNTEALV